MPASSHALQLRCSRRPASWKLWVQAVGLGLLAGILASRSGAAEPISFDRQIKPLLSDRCVLCHGPDENDRQLDLRLDTREGLFGETIASELEQVVVPGDAEASELLRRLTTDDPYERMPPADSNLSLSPEEIDLVRRWIEEGAAWEDHWAFGPIEMPELPSEATSDPAARSAWPAGPIDRFVQERLRRQGLRPQPSADRRTLLRRAALDLTGLPPTPEELERFEADERPDAYVRAVDRLLASPRFGQQMAVPWLDAARYADTYGYQADVYREMWPWRDWVVDAFNTGMPYDQFLLWQIAGDLIPDATEESILATGFNRNHRQTNEGGSIEEEFRVEYVADRVNTLGTAVLGLTLECARCHDHKYDPISQADYFQLFAFFNNIDESGLYSHFTNAVPSPTLLLPSDAQRAAIERSEAAVAEAEAALQQASGERGEAFDKWLAQLDPEWLADESFTLPGRVAAFAFESLDDEGKVPNEVEGAAPGETSGQPAIAPGVVGNALHLDGENNLRTKIGGDWTRDDPFTIAGWFRAAEAYDRAVLWHRSRSWTDAGSRGYELLVEDGRLSAALVHFWPGNAIRIQTVDPMPVDQWVHVAVTYDGSSRAAGLRIYVDGQAAATETVRDHLFKTINGGGADEFTVGQRFRDRGFKGGAVDQLELFARELAPLEIASLVDGEILIETARRAMASGSDDEDDAALDALRTFHAMAVDESLAQRREALRDKRRERSEAIEPVREVMVMEEMPQPRPTYVLARGEYDAPTEQVAAEVPEHLAPFADSWPRNRLGLAFWLTSPDHPLVARVAVNRFWQQLFDQPLVATPEDFGKQASTPTHPELLDWLAATLIERSWDTKGMLRRMALSSTYRQEASCPPETRAADPRNHLLSRGPGRRLPVETLRDAALAAGGLLVEQHGGPPVHPYQPDGLWEEKNASARYQRDVGAGSHRRSLYTIWKRTSPPPSMLLFDAPGREVCTARREATQTPLQALVLLNDPQYVEAARGIAARVLRETDGSPAAIVQRSCQWVLGRAASEPEQKILLALLEEQRAEFAGNGEAAQSFLDVGDFVADADVDPATLAAATVLAQTLLSFDPAVRHR